MGELGNTVVVDHQNGYKSSYSHLKDIRVRKGRSVSKGGIIGTVGVTGNSSGAHLHYEIMKDGKRINPEIFTHY
jgi:murein DD-endopeptidase MepM/ murein hydrolase activator NlpD